MAHCTTTKLPAVGGGVRDCAYGSTLPAAGFIHIEPNENIPKKAAMPAKSGITIRCNVATPHGAFAGMVTKASKAAGTTTTEFMENTVIASGLQEEGVLVVEFEFNERGRIRGPFKEFNSLLMSEAGACFLDGPDVDRRRVTTAKACLWAAQSIESSNGWDSDTGNLCRQAAKELKNLATRRSI